ncbi:MAG: prepilin peptidase [Bacilli bacterium]
MQMFTATMIFIFGLIFGSFYNVVGYRVPNNLSIMFPPSHCPNCDHKLKFYELIPVFSFIFLRGKCKSCKNKISFCYPIFELITGFLFLVSYLVFGLSMEFVIAITFISILIIITISDIKYFIIPDEVLIVGLILLVIEFIINAYITDASLVNELLIPLLKGSASFSMLYLFKVMGDFLFKKESMGGGDIKLLFLIGFVLGFSSSILVIFIASFIALPLSIIMLIRKNTNVIPFGPYLSLAAVIILLTKFDINAFMLMIN